MADDTKEVIVKQEKGERFALDHAGAVGLHGDARRDALRHEVAGKLVHATAPQQPLVHMVCWDEDRTCEIEGRVTLVGDDKAPIAVRMAHTFEGDHPQTHRFDTALHKPVHHALQMRTPLQVRFCNPWHVASDYFLEVRVGDRSVIGVRLTGATVATPQPCPDDEPCPPAVKDAAYP